MQLQPGAAAPVAVDIQKWKNVITIEMNKWFIKPPPPKLKKNLHQVSNAT